VTLSGLGAGTVTSQPAGISCGSACSYAFNSGTTVTLTAAAGTNAVFAGWTGACATATGTTCTLSLAGAASAGASFTVNAVGTALNCGAATVRCVSASAGPNQEYATIQAAADAAQPGDTVLVFAGSYTGFTVSRSGTAAAALRFLANDANVFIERGSASEADGIRLQNVSYVSIEGFNVRNTSTSSPRIHRCIAARGAVADAPMRGNVLRGNRCTDADAEGIYASQFNGGLIEGNTVTGSGRNGQTRMHGIYLANAGSDGTVIRGNVIANNGNAESEGIHCNGDASIGGDGLISNLVIEANRIYGNGNNGLNFDGVQDSLVQNNLVYGNGRHALRGYAIDAAAGPKGLRIVNNTLVSASGWAVKLSEDLGGHTVLNNILLGGTGSLAIGTTSVASANNVVQGVFSTNSEASTLSLAAWRTATGQDARSVSSTASALFVNAVAADFSLSGSSPARDAGLASLLNTAAPAKDLASNPRPSRGAFDIGAFEATQ
jgi:hypothetical protein